MGDRFRRRGPRSAAASHFVATCAVTAAVGVAAALSACELTFSTRTRGLDPEAAAVAGGTVGGILGGPVGRSIGENLGLILAGGVGAYALKKRGDAARSTRGSSVDLPPQH